MSAAELDAARAALNAERQCALVIGAVRVSGPTGMQSGHMGVCTRDAERSPMRGQNLYSLEGKSSVRLHRSTDGLWRISGTANMVAGS